MSRSPVTPPASLNAGRERETLRLRVNGKDVEVPAGLTIAALVGELGLGEGPVAVEINRAIVVRAEHATHVVHEGDEVEIVHFVGGG